MDCSAEPEHAPHPPLKSLPPGRQSGQSRAR